MKVEIIKPKTVLGKARYKLLEDVVLLGHLIHRGFISDGATTPRPAWGIFPPVSSYLEATILHDWALKHSGLPRLTCDKLFLRQMEVDGVSKPIRLIMFSAVVVYGFIKTAGYLRK